MKLKEFNQVTTPKLSGGGNKQARIGFSKGGVININGTACALMDIKPGDKVSIGQDEEDPLNWYVFKSDNGFELRTSYDKKGCLFNHSVLSKSFIKAIEHDEEATHGFTIAGKCTPGAKGDKTKYWGILIPAQV